MLGHGLGMDLTNYQWHTIRTFQPPELSSKWVTFLYKTCQRYFVVPTQNGQRQLAFLIKISPLPHTYMKMWVNHYILALCLKRLWYWVNTLKGKLCRCHYYDWIYQGKKCLFYSRSDMEYTATSLSWWARQDCWHSRDLLTVSAHYMKNILYTKYSFLMHSI